MNHSRISAFFTASAIVIAGLVAMSCASEQKSAESRPGPVERPVGAWWIPQSEPRFTTIGDETTYAMVHSSTTDLIVCEEPTHNGRLTWLVTVPCFPAFDVPMDVGRQGVRAWVIEQPSSLPAHMQSASGQIRILNRAGDELTAVLGLVAAGRAQTAGVTTQPQVRITRKVTCSRHQPYTPQPEEATARTGVSDQD